MAITNIPSNLANLVAPFLPAGQKPVGQETAENRNSSLKPVEQAAEAARTQIQLNERESQEEPAGHRQEAEAPEDGAEELLTDDEPVELYTARKTRRPAPRGCLLDDQA